MTHFYIVSYHIKLIRLLGRIVCKAQDVSLIMNSAGNEPTRSSWGLWWVVSSWAIYSTTTQPVMTGTSPSYILSSVSFYTGFIHPHFLCSDFVFNNTKSRILKSFVRAVNIFAVWAPLTSNLIENLRFGEGRNMDLHVLFFSLFLPFIRYFYTFLM